MCLSDDFVFEVCATGIQYRAIKCADGKYHIDRYMHDDERCIQYGSWHTDDIVKFINTGDWRFIKHIGSLVDIPELQIGDLI